MEPMTEEEMEFFDKVALGIAIFGLLFFVTMLCVRIFLNIVGM